MQISEGTCSVTQDSQTVIAGNGVDWSAIQTALGYGMPVFFSLIGSNEVGWPVANAISPGSSGSGFWELVLVSPWAGDTQADVAYTIHKDFTTNFNLPLPSPGDYQGAQLFGRAFEAIDAALLPNKGMLRARIDADQTGNSDGVLTNVTGLVFPVAIGVQYKFVFELLYQSDTATIGLKVGLTTPTFDLFVASVRIFGRAATGAGSAMEGVITASGGAVSADAVAVINTTYPALIEGTIKPSASGNVQVQFASETTGGIVTPKAGSNGRLWLA